MRITRVPADLCVALVCLVIVSFLTTAIWRWQANIGADTRIAAPPAP